MLNAYNAYKQKKENMEWCRSNFLNSRSLKSCDDVREQLKNMMIRLQVPLVSCGTNFENVKKCLLSGFFMQVAKLQRNGAYMAFKDIQTVAIHPSSVIDNKPDWVIYNEFVLTKRHYIRNITAIKGEYLFEVNPDYFNPARIKHTDTRRDLEKLEREIIEKRKKV